MVRLEDSGTGQVVQVTNTTQLMAQTTVPASSLQVNDMVQCTMNSSAAASSAATQTSGTTASGTTTSGTATQSASSRQAGILRRPGVFTRGGAASSSNIGRAAASPVNNGIARRAYVGTGQPSASVSGRITSTNPLMISTGGTGSAALSLPSNAPVTKFASISFSSLRVGDQIMVAGQANSSGTFIAARIAVNRNTISSSGSGR